MATFRLNRFVLQTALLGLVLIATAAFGASPVGHVDLFKGDVVILDDKGKATSREIKKGTQFFLGETIQTKANGRVKLIFQEGGKDGGNSVVLGANAVLKIERAATAANPSQAGTTLSLAAGEVRADVKRKYSGQGGDNFEVRTKNAVAGVRGTIFLTRIAKSGLTEVATERGAVAVKGLSGKAEVMVKPGMFASVAPAGQVAPPKPIASNPSLNQAVQSLGSTAGPSTTDSGPEASGGDAKPEPGAKSDNANKGDAPKSEEARSESPKDQGKSEGNGPANKAEAPKPNGDAPPPGALAREPVMDNPSGGRAPASVGAGGPGMAPPPSFMGQQTVAPRPPIMGGAMDAMKFVPGNTRPGDVMTQAPPVLPPPPKVIIKLE